MKNKKPPGDDKVISLNDVRKRVVAEAKKTGVTPADVFADLFGSIGKPLFGSVNPTPYDEALQKQQDEAQAEALLNKHVKPMIDKFVANFDTLKGAYDQLKGAYDKSVAAFDKAFNAYESWKAEAERLHDKLSNLRAEGVEVDLGYVIDGVIDTLRNDPRMPKLSLFEWEQLLGDHYGTETINISEDIGDDDNEEAA
jgi:hypothetical protein